MFEFLKKFKQKALVYGKSSEKTAEKYLRKKGYKIVETNYRCKKGEIDIIALHKKYLVFCEVKARRNQTYGSALEAVTPSKIRKIRLTAEDYLLKKNLKDADCRFDVLTIDETPDGTRMELITNAF
ncbi:MAG: YraN family protein [Nitrospinae bacterium]|nr:YraN family protein [Nitrospinota bacterium]